MTDSEKKRNWTMNKVVILTGASSGMGRASILPLLRAGFDLVLAARRIELLNVLVKEVESQGGKAIAVETDLRDEGDTERLFKTAMETCGRIDVLINVAGDNIIIPGEYVTRDMIRSIHEVNTFAPIQLMSLATPVMRAQGGGRIINVTSAASFFGGPFSGPYNASKASLERFTDTLRIEVRKFNIRVSSVISGNIKTPMWANAQINTRQTVNLDSSNPYTEMLLRGAELGEKTINTVAKGPEVIAKSILHAATAKRPKARYFVPFDSFMQCLIGRLLPAEVAVYAANKVLAKKPKKTDFVMDLPDDIV
jgi:NAD(P)-dependent dehydrogenase (short-subunit alcohol dehydrogenase family)